MVVRITRFVPTPCEPTLVISSGPKRREKASCASSVTSWPRKTRTECSSRAARAVWYAASSAAILTSVTPRSSAVKPGPRGTISIGDLPSAFGQLFHQIGQRAMLSATGAHTGPLPAAALLGLLEPIEQAPGVGAGEGLQPVRLTFLDGIACDRSSRAKELDLLLHLAVPHVMVKLADVHENAHLRDRLKLRCAGSPHVSGERRGGQEVLRVGCRDMQRCDPSVRRSCNVKLAALDLVVPHDHLQEFRKDPGATLKEHL